MSDNILSDGSTISEHIDVLYMQLINILHRNDDFNLALDRGTLDDAASVAISAAFDEAFDRNRRLANIFLADEVARREILSFWFARAYAEVQANAAFGKAFKRALAVTHPTEGAAS